MYTRMFGRIWPTPVAKPMAPFFAAGAIVYYGVYKGANAMMESEEFRNDPRHPKVKSGERKPIAPAKAH